MPPSPHLNVGYISSDFNNHPLAHLMQSVFGMHDPSRVRAHCYATTPSDNSPHRQQIEREAPRFYDASCWGPDRLINQIVQDGIHILVNLNGFTRGAKNEIFAARPAPIQMSFMGFAGTLGADWCDYLLADRTAVPPETLRPWRRNIDVEDGVHEDDEDSDWVYCENIVFTRHTFFCCDHRQSAPDTIGPRLSWEEEQERRWRMRKELFPDLPEDTVILGNFNQLYKVCASSLSTYKTSSYNCLYEYRISRLNLLLFAPGCVSSRGYPTPGCGCFASPTLESQICVNLPKNGLALKSPSVSSSLMSHRSNNTLLEPVSVMFSLIRRSVTLIRLLPTLHGQGPLF